MSAPAETPDFETLAVERIDEHVTIVRLNRPDASNALNTQMGRDLVRYFEDVALDPKGLRCIVLTGSGDKAFCAGGDLKERRGMTDEAWTRQHVIFERMVRALIDCPVPIIGAVNGAAYGGGCEIAGACDFLYAAETARFALTEVTLGIMPGGGGTQTLPRAVGERRAKELILTGKPFTVGGSPRLGFRERGISAVGVAAGRAGDRIAHRRQCADLRPPGKAVDPSRPATVAAGRPRAGDRGLQPHGPDRGPPRRRAGLQREADAEFQGQVKFVDTSPIGRGEAHRPERLWE